MEHVEGNVATIERTNVDIAVVEDIFEDQEFGDVEFMFITNGGSRVRNTMDTL